MLLFYAEGLSTKISNLEQDGLIRGVSLCSDALPISHILLADDCLIFFHTNESEGGHITNVLVDYTLASG